MLQLEDTEANNQRLCPIGIIGRMKHDHPNSMGLFYLRTNLYFTNRS